MYQHDEQPRLAGAIGRGRILVDGQETDFWLRGNTFFDFALTAEFTGPVRDLTELSGNSLGLLLEAQRDPEDDWLYTYFGPDPFGGKTGFAYERLESGSAGRSRRKLRPGTESRAGRLARRNAEQRPARPREGRSRAPRELGTEVA